MEENFEMVAKTLKGLEEVLAEELRGLGADNVQPGRRMVSFYGDKEMLYKANLCCRTALRILKPFYKFRANDPDALYEAVKDYDWGSILSLDKTFCIDTVANSDDFTHSHFVTYRVKDAIVDWFRDRYGSDKRPGVRLKDADVMINVHISDDDVTLSLDSSGESLHKRGYRVAQTEAPINEVLAAGIILLSGWRGDTTFIDPMCGSGTFLVEAALIAANINPGIYRTSFAFENWPDFDRQLFDRLYNDDSREREVTCRIYGADISPKATEIAAANIKSAGVGKYISLRTMPLSQWDDAPGPEGVLITNPPYGERISAPDMEALYTSIGTKLKNVFLGYHAWIIGYRDEYFHDIGLAPSQKIALMNGSLDCELREYIIFAGDKKSFLAGGGKLKHAPADDDDADNRRPQRMRADDHKGPRKFRDNDRGSRKFRDDDRPRASRYSEDTPRKFRDNDDRPRKFRDDDRGPRKFRDNDDRPRKFRDDDRGPRKFRDDDRGPRKFRDNDDRDFNREAPESENPMAKHHKPGMLNNFVVKKPRLTATDEEKPQMRSRGWRKKDIDNK